MKPLLKQDFTFIIDTAAETQGRACGLLPPPQAHPRDLTLGLSCHLAAIVTHQLARMDH